MLLERIAAEVRIEPEGGGVRVRNGGAAPAPLPAAAALARRYAASRCQRERLPRGGAQLPR